MTQGEVKFALRVEMALNRIPQPEYRQLTVEALMVLCQIVQHSDDNTRWDEVLRVDRLVAEANRIYVEEQVRAAIFKYHLKYYTCLFWVVDGVAR